MRTASCKAKGRRAAEEVVDLLYKYWPDGMPGDIRITSSSVAGEDIQLSPAARAVYPLVIEVKNQEKLNIWSSLKQAQGHLPNGQGSTCLIIPILFFKKNRTQLYAALDAEHLLKLIR